MDASTRQKMYQLAEGFSMKAHETSMVLHPVDQLLVHTADHCKQADEYVKQALKELAKIEDRLPMKDVRAVQSALKEAGAGIVRALERVGGAKTPLKRMIDAVDADLASK